MKIGYIKNGMYKARDEKFATRAFLYQVRHALAMILDAVEAEEWEEVEIMVKDTHSSIMDVLDTGVKTQGFKAQRRKGYEQYEPDPKDR